MSEPSVDAEIEALLAAWSAARASLGPFAPLVAPLLAAEASPSPGPRWVARAVAALLAEGLGAPLGVLDEALRDAILDPRDLVALARIGGVPEPVWCALLHHAADEAALTAVLAAIEHASAGQPAPELARLAVLALVDAGRLDEAARWLGRIEWPWHRARAAIALIEQRAGRAREALLDATWRHVLDAPAPALEHRVERLAELARLEEEGSPRCLERARALGELVETLPQGEHDVSPDHEDLRVLVALALLRARRPDEAEHWYRRVPVGQEHAASSIAAAFPEPRRTAFGLALLAQAAPQLSGPEPDAWLARALAEISPAVAEACLALVAHAPWDAERCVLRVELAAHVPAARDAALDAIDAGLADEGRRAALAERRGRLLDAVRTLGPSVRTERVVDALLEDVLSAQATDPYDLRDAARHAPLDALPVILDALERAARSTDAPYLVRSGLHLAVIEAHARAAAAGRDTLMARAVGLLARLHGPADVAYDADREALGALPPDVRAALVRAALRWRWDHLQLPARIDADAPALPSLDRIRARLRGGPSAQ